MALTTSRLLLRPWTDPDRPAFAAMSADDAVMEYLLPFATSEACDAWIDRQSAHLAQHGFGLWAVEERATGAFVGSIGLLHVAYNAHFTPAIEVGWRIARAFWGQGYAPEAAAAALRFGFEDLQLREIVANTVAANAKSQRVMLKLGMSRDPDGDFDHPRIPEGNALRRQILYRINRQAWQRRQVG